jgi:hypothetical protein
MTSYSNGNSFDALGSPPGGPVGDGAIRWPDPPWKGGLRPSDDRGGI